MARKYTRDNRGRFASVGATARGGRLKTAGSGKRQTQVMRAQAPGLRSNTIAKGGNGVRGSVARSLAAVKRKPAAEAPAVKPTLKRTGQTIKVATPQSRHRAAKAKADAAEKQTRPYTWDKQPYNPKNFFGNSKVRDANIAKASPEQLAQYKQLQQQYSRWTRGRNSTAKKAVELSNAAWGMRKAANRSRPGTILRRR